MKRLILSMMALVLTAAAVWAGRALSEPFTVVQPDGTTLTVTLQGDEHLSWLATDDGVLLVERRSAYYVAAVDDDGMLSATTLLAHRHGQRTALEQQLCQQQRQRSSLFAAQAERTMQQRRRAQVVNAEYFPHQGSPKCLVILVNFSDVQFASDDPKAQFEQYFNGETQQNLGHNEQNNLVSVREYFRQSSLGQFTPDFTVVGPVTLPETQDYYGKDEGSSKDVNFTQFCRDAIAAVDGEVDFHDFDNNGDGMAELVCIIYAGYGQSVGSNPANTIWPKCGYRGINTQDGVRVSYCNCSPELFRVDKKDDINGIGLFTHEFSHGMGLPDHYATNTNAQLDNQTPEFWDLMDYGEYAGNGYNPVPYSAWEQSAMGWIEIEELKESQTVFPLTPTVQGGKAYKFGNGGTSEECMLIEGELPTDHGNRRLGCYRGKGLLVWHIAYRSDRVSMGDYPNNTPNEPRVCIVPADGLVINGYRFVSNSATPTADKPWTQAQYVASLTGDPFPYTYTVTETTTDVETGEETETQTSVTVNTLTAAQSLPNYRFYNGETVPVQTLTHITQTPDGLISFDYNDGTTPVTHEVESLTLDVETLELTEGESLQLTATVLPAEAADKSVLWTTTNEQVATIADDGTVVAAAAGTALVIARSVEHPALWQSCAVTVSEAASAIREVSTRHRSAAAFYDLQGRRVAQPTRPGIYIQSGKKVAVK